MVKTRRFHNSLKSTPQPQTDAHPPAQPPVQNAPTKPPSPPIHAHPSPPSPPAQIDPESPTEPLLSPSIERPSHALTNSSSKDNAGCKKPADWTVEVIALDGSIKEITVKVKDVDNLPSGQRIIVSFDEQDAPYGEAQGVLAGYCGTLATDCKLFPIGFPRWSGPSGLPKTYFEKCFEKFIKPRFSFRTSEGIAKRYCNSSISKKWATHRQRLWTALYDPSMSRKEILSNVPPSIEKDQWVSFVRYRLQPSTLEICKKNKVNRSKQLVLHTGGSKANSRRRHEMFLKTGRKVSRGQMYIETHKKKDGSYVNEAARDIGEQIELALTQATGDESELSPNDAVGRVLGPEHPGRVRCMGMGAALTNTFKNTRLRLTNLTHSAGPSSSSVNWQEKFVQLESQVQGTMNVLKAYMIKKEGRIPEEFASLFGSESQVFKPSDNAGEPTTPSYGSRSSSCSNTNHEENV